MAGHTSILVVHMGGRYDVSIGGDDFLHLAIPFAGIFAVRPDEFLHDEMLVGTRPLLTELKRIGNNLNQISTKINAGAFTSYNFQEVIDLQKAIYEELYRINRGAPWQP